MFDDIFTLSKTENLDLTINSIPSCRLDPEEVSNYLFLFNHKYFLKFSELLLMFTHRAFNLIECEIPICPYLKQRLQQVWQLYSKNQNFKSRVFEFSFVSVKYRS